MPDPPARAPAFEAVYRAHHGFVWRTLQHLGIDAARLDDAAQDVFLVVHRRLPEFAGRASVRTWLFEIARRVASRYRRSAAREPPRDSLVETRVAAPASPTLERAEAMTIVAQLLAELVPEQALVFVLAELEQWRAPEIAEELGVNVNTVYSRLRAARRELDRLVRRIDARDRRIRSGAAVLMCLGLARPRVPAPLAAAPLEAVRPGMLSHTWSSGPVTMSAATASASGSGALAIAGVALAALVTFGAGAQGSGPSPEPVPAEVAGVPREPVARAEGAPPTALAPAPAVTVATAPKRGHSRYEAAEDPLAAELALVESIRAAALAQDDRAVLARVARHQHRFPAGIFAQEAAAAAIEARCRLGARAEALRAADEFLAHWPTSNLAARVASLCRS